MFIKQILYSLNYSTSSVIPTQWLHRPNVIGQWLVLALRIREDPGSNLAPGITNLERFFGGTPQFL
jgi:hypothetical protein